MQTVFRSLFIHGVGEQTSDFADDARRNLRVACNARGKALFATQVHWAKLADKYETRFLADAALRGSNANMTQKLVVSTLADALMYTTSTTLRPACFRALDQQFDLVGNRGTIFAHSLGGLIATDWLRERPGIRDVRLVTLGCNIGLFNLDRTFVPVPQLLVPGRWINVFSPRDMLGFPLGIDPTLRHVQDVAVGVGGWFRGWTGLAHTQYWNDDDLWSKTLPKLLGI